MIFAASGFEIGRPSPETTAPFFLPDLAVGEDVTTVEQAKRKETTTGSEKNCILIILKKD